MKRLAILLLALPMAANAIPVSIDFEFSPITVSFNGVVQSTGNIQMSIVTDTETANLGSSFGSFSNAYAADVFFTAESLGLSNTRVTNTTTLYFGGSVVGWSADGNVFNTIFTAFVGSNLTFGTEFDLSTLVVPQGPIEKTGTEFRTIGERITFANGSYFDEGQFFSFADQLNTVTVRAISVPEPGALALLGIGLLGIGLARRRRTQ